MGRLAVAATAPFGADVLEGLAAQHEIAYLLTRPDKPRGRGRRTGPPPAKERAEALGIPVRQEPRLDGDVELGVDTIVVAAYGLLIPEVLLDRASWINVHPSLLPRWRGAAPVERAIMAGDTETGVTIHETTPALDAGPIAAQEAFPIGPDDDSGAIYAKAAPLAVQLLGPVLAGDAEFRPQPEEGVTYADKLTAADRELDPEAPVEEQLRIIRALSPHIGAHTTLHGRRATLWRALAHPGRRAHPGGGAARGPQADGLRRVPAGPALISPARRAAHETIVRVFEHEAYADRAFRTAAKGLDPRDRALAQRLAYGTIQRVRTLDHGIEALGKRPVRKLDPPVRAALRLGAYQLAYSEVADHAAVTESVELVRRARLERAVPFTNAVLRRLAEGLRPLVAALPEGTARQAALRHSYPDWVAETWWAELGPEEALALLRAQNEPGDLVVRLNRRREGAVEGRPDPDLPDALHVDRVDERALAEGLVWPQSVGSQLAGLAVGAQEGERTLDLCAAPGGKATQLAGDVVAVEVNAGRAAELRANVERLGATNVTVVEADALALPAELTGFDRVLVDAPCSGLGVLARRPDLRWRGEPLVELQTALLREAAARVRPGGTIVYSVCTINAAENEGVVDASGLEVEPLGDEWPRFRHPRRPELLLTLPHKHGTSGFFIARLRAPS